MASKRGRVQSDAERSRRRRRLPGPLLLQAAIDGDEAAARDLVASGVDVDWRNPDSDGATPLLGTPGSS